MTKLIDFEGKDKPLYFVPTDRFIYNLQATHFPVSLVKIELHQNAAKVYFTQWEYGNWGFCLVLYKHFAEKRLLELELVRYEKFRSDFY